jgi:hypothetical protein
MNEPTPTRVHVVLAEDSQRDPEPIHVRIVAAEDSEEPVELDDNQDQDL